LNQHAVIDASHDCSFGHPEEILSVSAKDAGMKEMAR
jgi:hypothetical protein